MKLNKIIIGLCIVSEFTISCGSNATNKDQPIDSTSNIVLPEDRSSDSVGATPGSSTVTDSSVQNGMKDSLKGK